MDGLILHKHGIEVMIHSLYSRENKNIYYSPLSKIHIENNYLYGFKCKNCDDFLKDYKSINDFSFFYLKSSGDILKNYDYTKFFEFFEFSNSILIGTKMEIISYISKKYITLKDENYNLNKTIDSTKKEKEKDIKKIKDELHKEILENKKLKKELDNEKKKNEDMNEENSQLKKEKENLIKNKEDLSKRIENEKEKNKKLVDEKKKNEDLNEENSQLKKEKENLIKNKEDLSKRIENEKEKNKKLNNKLDNISFEFNQNIKKALEQVENEKLINQKLQSDFSNLKKKENSQNKKNEELNESLRQKQKIIEDLTKENKNYKNKIINLEEQLNSKENENKELKNSLCNEKNNYINITKNLKNEQYKNKKLNDKLDNISIENNNNMKMVLEQLQSEKLKNDKLLKNKDEEIKNMSQNKGLKFDSDQKSGEYDIILNITSFKDLIKEGWLIKYNKKDGKNIYDQKKDKPTIIVGVIGNGNKGKSFILEKLSNYEIPKGFNVKTEGLSIRYGTTEDHNVAILDSAGQETPLLEAIKNNDNKERVTSSGDEERNKENLSESENANSFKKENDNKENKEINNKKDEDKMNQQIKLEDEDSEFELYSRDKLITEFFIQKFIIWKSHILILVVGNISLTEQKLLSRVKSEVESMNKDKQIYVIHNLKDFSEKEQVEDYIENTLKKLYKIDIEEIYRQNINNQNISDNTKNFNKYFVEKGKNVMHLICVNDFSPLNEFYNVPTINYIQKEIESVKTRNAFSIIDDCKKFLIKISEEIMDENPQEKNLVIEEGEKSDKIVLKNLEKINLKKFIVDEMGYTLNNDSNIPKYSYYINTEDKSLYINIELPGGGTIIPKINIISGYYIFIFEGVKKGDLAIEEDKKNQISKLLLKKNLRKSNKFKLEIKIPNSVMQIKVEEGEELSDSGEVSDDKKGVYTFKYKVLIVNQKSDKPKKPKKYEF